MKINILLILVPLFLLSSCEPYYQFVQIQEYSVNGNKSLISENDDVRIEFFIGNSSQTPYWHTIYNKTDKFILIDKSKSFVVDKYDVAHNFVDANEKIETSVYTNSEVIIIPPNAKKVIYSVNGYSPSLILHCSLQQYPSGPVYVNLGTTEYIDITTYHVDGRDSSTTLYNTISLDRVINSPEFCYAKYTLRPDVCDNMRESGKIYPPHDAEIYDFSYNVGANAVTIPYYIQSSKKYYKHLKEYIYSPTYKGYYRIKK